MHLVIALLFVLGVAHTDPFFCASWAKKWQFLEVLPIFFRNTRLQLKLLIIIESNTIFHWKPAKNKVGVVLVQNLGQIRSNVVKKVKKLALSIHFSHTSHGEYMLKQEVVVAQTPGWKFKANIARNAIFQGR